MAEFVKVASLSEIPSGTAKVVEAGGRSLALYNIAGAVHATDNACPHRGGSLGEGDLKGKVITCPWHGFQYDLTSGACMTNGALKVACHPVRLDGDSILVEV